MGVYREYFLLKMEKINGESNLLKKKTKKKFNNFFLQNRIISTI